MKQTAQSAARGNCLFSMQASSHVRAFSPMHEGGSVVFLEILPFHFMDDSIRNRSLYAGTAINTIMGSFVFFFGPSTFPHLYVKICRMVECRSSDGNNTYILRFSFRISFLFPLHFLLLLFLLPLYYHTNHSTKTKQKQQRAKASHLGYRSHHTQPAHMRNRACNRKKRDSTNNTGTKTHYTSFL